jgi:hypothetical protein
VGLELKENDMGTNIKGSDAKYVKDGKVKGQHANIRSGKSRPADRRASGKKVK